MHTRPEFLRDLCWNKPRSRVAATVCETIAGTNHARASLQRSARPLQEQTTLARRCNGLRDLCRSKLRSHVAGTVCETSAGTNHARASLQRSARLL